jgi:hypothetical protein
MFVVQATRETMKMNCYDRAGNTKGGKYHFTIDLLFDWIGLVCFANKNKN